MNRMKTVLVILISFGSCLLEGRDGALLAGLDKGVVAKVHLEVVDENGFPVTNAKIFGGFTSGPLLNDYVVIEGSTDTNGEFVAEGRCNDFLRFEVRKDGYYCTEEKIYFSRTKAEPAVIDGRWQPYGERRKTVLKSIKNPIELVATEGAIQAPTSFGEWYGFDLERRQWRFLGSMRANAVFFNPNPNDTNLEDAETARLSRLSFTQSQELERKRKLKGAQQ